MACVSLFLTSPEMQVPGLGPLRGDQPREDDAGMVGPARWTRAEEVVVAQGRLWKVAIGRRRGSREKRHFRRLPHSVQQAHGGRDGEEIWWVTKKRHKRALRAVSWFINGRLIESFSFISSTWFTEVVLVYVQPLAADHLRLRCRRPRIPIREKFRTWVWTIPHLIPWTMVKKMNDSWACYGKTLVSGARSWPSIVPPDHL